MLQKPTLWLTICFFLCSCTGSYAHSRCKSCLRVEVKQGALRICVMQTHSLFNAFSLYVYADTHILMHEYIISTCTLIVSRRVVYTEEKNKTHSLRILRTMRDMYQNNREGVSQQHHPAHPRSRKCKTQLSSV